MAEVVKMGEFANESERDCVRYFRERLPDSYIIFHNLQVAGENKFKYEIDAIIVGNFAVYVIDFKNYSGVIKGNLYQWHLEYGAPVPSPIDANEMKAKVVKGKLTTHSTTLSRVFVQSLIVICDDNAQIRIKGVGAETVMTRREANLHMQGMSGLPVHVSDISFLRSLIRGAITRYYESTSSKQIISNYEIIKVIKGRNKLYKFYLAKHREVMRHKTFNLKVYDFDIYRSKPERDKQSREIERASVALHEMPEHPNIIKAYLPFPWAGNQYILPLEWVDGHLLRELIDDKTLSFDKKINIILKVCTGMIHAHKHGVIHRNLTPDNIVVTEEGGVKIVNFDYARVENMDLLTIATKVKREIDQRYAAPEVMENASLASVKSDIYSIGIIFFELLADKTPYIRYADIKKIDCLPKLPSELNSTLNSDVDDMVRMMCDFNIEARLENLTEVVEFLELFLQ